MTYFGKAENASDGWSFPEDAFPDATHIRPSDEGSAIKAKEIPKPMIVTTSMAVSALYTVTARY